MITLTAGDATLTLAPEIGGAVVEWRRGGLPMFRASGAEALAARSARALASYPLVPFSNRIAGRRFAWRRTEYDLPEQFGGFAIHGVGWLRTWEVAAQAADSATITLTDGPSAEWPFRLRAWQRFTLTPDALVAVIGVANTDTVPWPAGIGQHPFFPRGRDTRLTFRAESVWHNGGASQVPTHRTAPPEDWDYSGGGLVGRSFVDNCFAGWDGFASIDYPDLGYRLTMTAGAPFRHTVLYMPDGQPFFAMEPVSHMNDAINRMTTEADHGLVVLQPGAQIEGSVTYAVSGL